jgi:hypothetical protein
VTVTKLPGYKMTKRLSDARFNSIDIPELIGLCRGVMADGSINLTEAEFIFNWLNDRNGVLQTWPADELHKLLSRILEDKALSLDEEVELSDLLEEIIGDPISIMIY